MEPDRQWLRVVERQRDAALMGYEEIVRRCRRLTEEYEQLEALLAESRDRVRSLEGRLDRAAKALHVGE